MKSHVRGNTRSNRGMKNKNNWPAWHSQMDNILKRAQMNSEQLRVAGKAANAYGNQPASSLPPAANKAERNAATRRRLMDELVDLEMKKHRSNENNSRIRNLKYALSRF
jgi:hypothetical protein